MSSPQWMPLDIDAYLSDTFHLSAAEHGAYMLLIMRYWKDGGLPDDERMIARYSRLSPEQWAESRDALAAFFEPGWKHKRIDAELAKAAEIIGKRKAAADAKHAKSKCSAHAEQMQSTSTYTRVPPSPLPEPEEDNPQAQHLGPARSRAELDEIERVCREAGGLERDPSPGFLNTSILVGLIDAGCEVQLDLVPTIRQLIARARRRPTSWEYFREAALENAARRRQVAAAGIPVLPPGQTGPPGAPKPTLAAGFGRLATEMRQQREIRSGTSGGGVQSPVLDLPAIRHG